MKYLVIGNGAAGADTALSIRQQDSSGEISIITDSLRPYYYRPKLIDYIAEDFPADKLTIVSNDAFAAKNIRMYNGFSVTAVDPDAKHVICAGGEVFPYDRLMLATGSRPFVPDMQGMQKAGVFTLRTIEDADMIKQWCRGKKDVVISGGGLLGIETANALKNFCETITIVDTNACLLSRQLDSDGAKLLQKFLEAKALCFIFEDCAVSIEGQSVITGVRLRSGRVIPADAMIISAGVRPDTALAEKAGIAVNRGIVVDAYMQTSLPDIYAAGDCAEFEGKSYGLWTVGKEQGKLAGANMAGVKTEYRGSIPSTMLKVTGIDLYSAGDFSGAASWSMVKLDDERYLKLVYEGDTPKGAIVIGDAEAVKLAQKVMSGKAPIDEFKKLIQ